MSEPSSFSDASLMWLCQAISQGNITAEELIRSSLSKIQSENPRLNAVICVNEETAREKALEADRARSKNECWGPLHGIPMTIKDSFDSSGIVTTAGTIGRKKFIPECDATVVARLKAAGAILIGKTNTPELTLSYQTNNEIFGRTGNPYDLSRTSGGSSGGAAAIVSTGAVPFDIGSDTSGSLRIPAHYCGVVSLKPTEGRVPRSGHIIQFGGYLDRLTTIGPIAKFVDDVEYILPIIAGPDGIDPAIYPVPIGQSQNVQLDSLRVAFYHDNGIAEPTHETVETVKEAANAIRSQVFSVKNAVPPRESDAPKLFAELYAADGGAWRRRLLFAANTIDSPDIPEEVYNGLRGDQFSALIERWDIYRSDMLQFLNEYDVIICPVTATPAPLHGQGIASAFSYTQSYSLTGWPCVVVRCGTSDDLPIGLQVIAHPWREDVAICVARHLEMALATSHVHHNIES
jgi:amidase